MNKKSGRPEELVSCADCGRSGECGPFSHHVPVDQELFHSHFSAILWGSGAEGWVQKWRWWYFEWRWVFRLFWFVSSWGLRTRSYALGSGEKGKKQVWAFVCPAFLWGGYFFVCVVVDDSETVWKHPETQATCFLVSGDAPVTKRCVGSAEVPGANQKNVETWILGEQPHLELWGAQTPALLGSCIDATPLATYPIFSRGKQKRARSIKEAKGMCS